MGLDGENDGQTERLSLSQRVEHSEQNQWSVTWLEEAGDIK